MAEFIEAPTFRKKNNLSVTLITLLIIGLVAMIVLAFIWRVPGINKMRAGISSRSINSGDGIYYSDTTEVAKEWFWDFGDERFSTVSSGWHRYEKPGDYIVRLKINNSDHYTITFPVSVKDTVHQPLVKDSIKIIALKKAVPGYIVEFKAKGTGSEPCTWFFGDEGNMEHKGPPVMPHAYKEPGVYNVYVYSADNRSAKHTIKIEKILDADGIAIKIQQEADDFKYRLQQIADENGDFNGHYYYLMNKYLCSNDEAIMKINNDKTNTFYHYCRDLHLDKGLLVQSVKLTYNDQCVISAEIVQVNTTSPTTASALYQK